MAAIAFTHLALLSMLLCTAVTGLSSQEQNLQRLLFLAGENELQTYEQQQQQQTVGRRSLIYSEEDEPRARHQETVDEKLVRIRALAGENGNEDELYLQTQQQQQKQQQPQQRQPNYITYDDTTQRGSIGQPAVTVSDDHESIRRIRALAGEEESQPHFTQQQQTYSENSYRRSVLAQPKQQVDDDNDNIRRIRDLAEGNPSIASYSDPRDRRSDQYKNQIEQNPYQNQLQQQQKQSLRETQQEAIPSPYRRLQAQAQMQQQESEEFLPRPTAYPEVSMERRNKRSKIPSVQESRAAQSKVPSVPYSGAPTLKNTGFLFKLDHELVTHADKATLNAICRNVLGPNEACSRKSVLVTACGLAEENGLQECLDEAMSYSEGSKSFQSSSSSSSSSSDKGMSGAGIAFLVLFILCLLVLLVATVYKHKEHIRSLKKSRAGQRSTDSPSEEC